MDTPLPVMRGRYCRRSRALNGAMQAADLMLSAGRPLAKRGGPIQPPKRLLIANTAHLGDLVVATALLPVLKSAFPECKIGFLIGSWARCVLEGHPLVGDIHILDQWASNRAAVPRRDKRRRYFRTRREALREVKAAGYDTAIDLSWSFPNTLPFLWQAQIPVRIGYHSGGGGPLATHSLDFDARDLHVSERHLALVRLLPVGEKDLAKFTPNLAPIRAVDQVDWERKMQAAGLARGDYAVFHAGAGGSLKVWPAAKWRLLTQRWLEAGSTVVFTGFGEKDSALIDEITAGLSGCVNMCGQLGWGGLVAAITQARLVICVDTVAGHIAGAAGTPCAVIMTGQNPCLWHPLGQSHQVVTHSVPCAPCHRGLGCAEMECIRGVEIEQVISAARALVSDQLLPAAGSKDS
jgi:ADP-heptose:LPS heptosyltransferase